MKLPTVFFLYKKNIYKIILFPQTLSHESQLKSLAEHFLSLLN